MIADQGLLFDYEAKAFGTGKARISPSYIPALKLKYACQALEGVRGRILDVACGGGGMTEALGFYRPDLEVHGTDFSRSSLRMASENDSTSLFSAGDAFHLPFSSNTFDAVVMFDFLEHLENPSGVIREVRRILKAGGIYHTAVPFEGEPGTLHGLLWKLGWKAKVIHCGHVQMYRHGEPEDLIAKEGLEIINRQWTAHFIYQIADVMYFSWLYARGRPVQYSIEGYLEVAQSGPKSMILSMLKSSVASLSYLESTVLSSLPAGFGHLTSAKA